MSLAANYSSGSTYDLTYTVDNDMETINVCESGAAYDLTKLVYIIYLGDEGLYWSDSGAVGTTVTHYYGLVFRKSTSDSSSPNYTSTVGGTYTLTGIQGSSQTFTITLTPNSGFSFTSTTNVALYPGTSGSLFGFNGDDTVTQTGAAINGSGQLVLTLTDSNFNTGHSGNFSYLNIVGNAVGSTTGTGISVSRSTTGFSGTSSSAWSAATVFINPSFNNLSDATQLFATNQMSTNAQAGWYAQNISGSGWCYRYWTGSGFSSININGVSNSPGSWYDISMTNTSLYGTVGQTMYSNSTNNACTSPTSPNDIATNKIWSTTSDLDSLTAGQAHWAVGAASGSNAPVNFTDAGSTYGSGYISVTPCFRLLGYDFSSGKVSRYFASCVESSGIYDVQDGGGYCSTSSGGGGGGGGSSFQYVF
jgi:hypothetical protein